MSVRQVTQRNTGRKTAGIDREVALTSRARADLAVRVHRPSGPGPRCRSGACIYRKQRRKTRPLGIPVLADRVPAARVRNALEPEWEARLEPDPTDSGRAAAATTRSTMITGHRAERRETRDWVLDADLKAAFDKIDHNFLLERSGSFPAREQVREWLRAGVVDKGGTRRPKREPLKAASYLRCY